MRIKCNQWLMIGVILVAVGIQFRVFESFVLNEKATAFLHEHLNKPTAANQPVNPLTTLWAAAGPPPRKRIDPPAWLGWALLSAGGVLILHSAILRRVQG